MMRNSGFMASMKRLLSCFICICLVFCLGTAIFAVDDEPLDDNPVGDTDVGDQNGEGAEGDPATGDDPLDDGHDHTEDQPETPTVNELESCICGRPYYTADGDKHYKYDCIACGENLYLCKCACWCGADSYSGMSNIGTQQLFCSKCKKACSDCVCADKETALLRESEIRNGTLSVMGIKKAESVFPVLFLLLFTVALCCLGIYSYRYTYGREMPTVPKKSKASADGSRPVVTKVRQDTAPIRIPTTPEDWPLKGRAPAIGLYAASVYEITGRRSSAPGVYPLAGAKKITLTYNDLAGLLGLSGLENKNAALSVGEDGGSYGNLISLGFAVEGEDSVTLTDKGRVYACILFTPEEVICVSAVSSAVYSVCFLRGYGIAVIKENGAYTLVTDVKKSVLSEFVRDNLEPVMGGGYAGSNFSASLSYEEWTVLLAAYSEGQRFTAPALSRVEKVNRINGILSSSSTRSIYPAPEKILDTEPVAEGLESLVKKGLLENADGIFTLTAKGRSLSYSGLKDMVLFDRQSLDGMEITLLAVYRSSAEDGNTVTLICDTGRDVRIISSGNIPWNKYME